MAYHIRDDSSRPGKSVQVELQNNRTRCLDTIYSLCSVYYPNIRWRSDMLKRWNFLKTGFYEGIIIVR